MADTITARPTLTAANEKLSKQLEKIPGSSDEDWTPELEKFHADITRLKASARTAWQKRLIEEHYTNELLNQALARAALTKLLMSDDKEIIFKAAKELRAAMRSDRRPTTVNVDKMMVVEDVGVTKLKEEL